MDPKAASLLRCFVDKLGGEVQVAVRRGSGRSEHWESFTENQETVTGFDQEQGVVELELRDGQAVRPHFNGTQLLHLLEAAGADGTEAWGEPLSDEEAAARFLIVHLDESLAVHPARVRLVDIQGREIPSGATLGSAPASTSGLNGRLDLSTQAGM